MKNRVGRMLTCALAVSAASLGTSCGLIPWFGGGYSLEVQPAGNVASQLQSLYIIVSPKSEVQEPLLSSTKFGELLDEDRMRKYTSFVQFEPLEAGSWKLVFQGNQSAFVEHEVDEEVIHLSIDHELIEKSSMSEYCVVVLAFFGSEGFEQVTVNHTSLDANAEQIVEVGGGSLSLRDA